MHNDFSLQIIKPAHHTDKVFEGQLSQQVQHIMKCCVKCSSECEAHTDKEYALCGSLSPQHGAFPGCGWNTWTPDTEGSCEYNE
jgi:hypothetical protein